MDCYASFETKSRGTKRCESCRQVRAYNQKFNHRQSEIEKRNYQLCKLQQSVPLIPNVRMSIIFIA